MPRALTMILVVLVGTASLPARDRVEHVILISIDGLRPEFYLNQEWPAPTLQYMARRGSAAEGVRGVFPTVTYPSHTTLVTGALPARHGIYYNTPFEPEGQTGRWYWEESLIQSRTLWDAAREAGLVTAAVHWPVTVGAPIDYNVPEFWSLVKSDPPFSALRERTQPPGLWDEIEREATGRLTVANFTPDFLARDDSVARAAAYLLAKYHPALLAIHVLGTDHFQHEDGRDSPRVRRAVAAADRSVAVLLETAESLEILDRTAFIITGDHGFVNIHSRLAPNIWLAEAGLRSPGSDRGDWRATFHSTGGSAFLQLRDPGDHQAAQIVRSLLAELPVRYRRLFRVVEGKELSEIGADPSVPLALTGVPGVKFTSSAAPPVLGPSSGGTHGFFPDFPEIMTGFVGFGAGFKQGFRAHRIGMEDIAPTIARLLGLRFEAPDGEALDGFLDLDQN